MTPDSKLGGAVRTPPPAEITPPLIHLLFPAECLVFLGSKTTCKDRWRQVLNEANRIPHKYLFTLQEGALPNQLDEMRDENLTPVVPKALHKSYPKGGDIITLREFIEVVRVTAV